MERTLSPEEKIKRAEEIYARRRSGYARPTVATVKVSEEKDYGLFRKMILQILICLVIYFIFYLIQNSNYVFSQDVINKTQEILSYDIDMGQMWNGVANSFNAWAQSIVPDSTNNIIQENNSINMIDQNAIGGAELENVILETATLGASQENNTVAEEQDNQTTQTNQEVQTSENVEQLIDSESKENGEEKQVNEEQKKQEEVVPQTNEEYIRTNFSFIKPVEGIVSSEFGIRNVDNPIVSKNHAGIDIAANTGTVIKASMEGTVTVSSTIGEYGYHIKITNNDVSTLYAHCSKLYVNAGDIIKQGQEIAEVGTTGNSTGPHLHFEIMRGTTYINPRDILEF